MFTMSGYDLDRNSYSSTDTTKTYAVSCETPLVLSLGSLSVGATKCSGSTVGKLF